MSAQTDAVQAAAAELYGLPPDQFTAARNARAKQTRADGDKEAAAAITKLAKPNLVAWLANQLVRDRGDELGPLLEVGAAMREATAALNADQLRQLSRQQRQIVQGLVQQARELARAAGQAVSDSTSRCLEETLHAALADERAAQELSKGTLSAGLSRSGFPGMESGADLGSWAAAPRAAASATAAAGTRAAHGATSPAGTRARRAPESQEEAATRAEQAAAAARREKADRARGDEAAARSDAESARQALDQARTALADADRAADDAASDVERLQAELGAAMQAQSAAAGAKRKARREVDVADRIARQSERRLRDAAARLAELQD